MLEIYVDVIQNSLFEEFGSKWEYFTEMMKDDKKSELEQKLKDKLTHKINEQIKTVERNITT